MRKLSAAFGLFHAPVTLNKVKDTEPGMKM